MIRPVIRYLQYKLLVKHRKGHGIHSPFMFELMTKILMDDSVNDQFQLIESIRHRLMKSTAKIHVSDYGAGSKVIKSEVRKVSKITKTSVLGKKYGRLLYRLVNYFAPVTVIELGTSFGLSTLYMSLATDHSKIYTMEGCPEISTIAQDNFLLCHADNIALIVDRFDPVFLNLLSHSSPPYFVYIDGNHRFEPTIRYFETCLEFFDDQSILIISDIYWSKEMEKAWRMICSHRRVMVTVDIFQMGIVFFKKGLSKQNFVIKF